MRLLSALSFAFAFVLAAPVVAAADVPQRVFISGHSLIDMPVPDHLARIADSLGSPLQWNRQYVVGSAIRDRTRGYDRETGWSGYSTGWNRQGEGLDVIHEFKQPRTTDGRPYDTLVITEQHGVLDSLLLSDTIRYLRHYHERFIAGNAAGQTWFYEPWLGVIDKGDPGRWLAYERAAAPLWQCIVTRINTSLAAEGRPDRIRSLPASLALATLVERAARGQVPGLVAGNARAAMEQIFFDTVHTKPLGAYYIALVMYAAMWDRPPTGAWAPDNVSPQLAAALQQIAWEAVSADRAARKPLPLDRCGAYARQLMPAYLSHMRDDYWAQQPDAGSFRSTYRRLKRGLLLRWQLWVARDGDPFRYDAATDKTYWLPAP